jgi:antitoxin component of RelBE/YafQ-DinJ toxin-antitoxin module
MLPIQDKVHLSVVFKVLVLELIKVLAVFLQLMIVNQRLPFKLGSTMESVPQLQSTLIEE